jgi:hypothetical protein
MKILTFELWVPDDTPTAAVETRVSMQTFQDYLLTLQADTTVERLTEEQIAQRANGIARREYEATIRGIVEDLTRAIKDKEVTDRDGAMDWLHETIDGHHDVIYTYAAMEVCRQSKNDQAYFDQFGSEGAMDESGIQWSRLAYCALEADVLEEIGDIDDLFATEDDEETVDTE